MTGVLIRRPWEKDTNLKTETEMGAMRKPGLVAPPTLGTDLPRVSGRVRP